MPAGGLLDWPGQLGGWLARSWPRLATFIVSVVATVVFLAVAGWVMAALAYWSVWSSDAAGGTWLEITTTRPGGVDRADRGGLASPCARAGYHRHRRPIPTTRPRPQRRPVDAARGLDQPERGPAGSTGAHRRHTRGPKPPLKDPVKHPGETSMGVSVPMSASGWVLDDHTETDTPKPGNPQVNTGGGPR